MDKKNCLGCRNNHYNMSGNCWNLEDAKIIQVKEVPLDQRPPCNQPPSSKPNCYRKQGYVHVKPEQIC
ncbi:hypothetical protein Syn6312_2854 [Synechococcus sp. PCC 6312]|nr:hypothetical protein Syn6312_2854 [Synechococcus sp. PCC 6312]